MHPFIIGLAHAPRSATLGPSSVLVSSATAITLSTETGEHPEREELIVHDAANALGGRKITMGTIIQKAVSRRPNRVCVGVPYVIREIDLSR